MNVAWGIGKKTTATAIGAATVMALTLGCGAAGATKAGKTTDTIVLRAAGYSDSPAVDYFRSRVLQLSHGALRVNLDEGLNNGNLDAEQRMVKDVARGTADIGWVRTWAFDTLGVKSFQALTAPTLVDSYALQGAVIASGIPEQMLPSLGKIGVTGLAVLADYLRKPEAVKRPLLSPADWRGVGFVIRNSSANVDALNSLGAHPIIAGAGEYARLAGNGKLQGLEYSLSSYRTGGWEAVLPYVTANVNLWPMMYALIVNPGRLAKLTADEQKWLRRAAADAAARSAELADRDASFVAQLCGPGHVARFANASTADLAALRAAFAPAVAKLEQDRQTKSFIARIQRLKRSTTREPALQIPARCGVPTRTTAGVSAARKNPASVLNGVYRASFTQQELIAGGATPKEAHDNYGIQTLWLKDGRFHQRDVNILAGMGECRGQYTVSGKTVKINFNVRGCSGFVVATWSLGNGQLRLHVTLADTVDKVIYGTKPFRKIG